MNARPNNNQLITYYACVSYLQRIHRIYLQYFQITYPLKFFGHKEVKASTAVNVIGGASDASSTKCFSEKRHFMPSHWSALTARSWITKMLSNFRMTFRSVEMQRILFGRFSLTGIGSFCNLQ